MLIVPRVRVHNRNVPGYPCMVDGRVEGTGDLLIEAFARKGSACRPGFGESQEWDNLTTGRAAAPALLPERSGSRCFDYASLSSIAHLMAARGDVKTDTQPE